MFERHRIVWFLILALKAGFLAFSAGAETNQPNFLFLFSDDQTFRALQSAENPDIKTPNLDRLRSRGVQFTHCFNQGSWSGAVCVSSRAMLHTGRYLYHAQRSLHPLLPKWAKGELRDPDPSAAVPPLWGETLGKAGYETYMTGKWHVGAEALARSFQRVGETGGGMLPSTGKGEQDPYKRPAPGNTWAPDDPALGGHWMTLPDGGIVHSNERWANQALAFLEEAAGKESPFFLYVAFHAPHDPRQAPSEFLDLYPADAIKVPPNFLPEHPFVQGDAKIRDENLAPFPRTREVVQTHIREYFALVSHMDAQIGRILDQLDNSPAAKNTVVMFSSDHGLAVGQHGLMGKQNQYDHSVRMPLILAGPGIRSGQTVDAPVYLQSLYATSCELAGLPVPESVEYPSLLPLLNGTGKPPHDAIFGAYKDLQRMIRTEEYKLILYPKAEKEQLFEVKSDPWEMKNLANNPLFAPRIKELKNRLRRLQKEVGDPLVDD